MNCFMHALLALAIVSFTNIPILAQNDASRTSLDKDQEKYWKSIAKLPYPKLNKKELHQVTKTYIVNPLNKWKEGEGFNDFKCKYHNLTKRRSTTLKSTNNSIEATIELTKENGETLTFDFQLLTSVFLVYSDHYEFRVYAINAKKNKDDQWGRLYDFAKQLK